jgi:hypothetical protein
MPGAVQRPQPGGVTLDTSLPPRGIWHITWDALNASGGQPDFGAVADYLVGKEWCPHIMWNPFTGYMEQYYPADVGARALTYNDQDGAACVQVEIFFTPGCVVDGVKYNTVADTPLNGWAELLAWMDSLGIPRQWPMGAPQWSGNSRDPDVWNANGGHYGHCHSPGDTHTDPGPMPSLNTGTIAVEGVIVPSTESLFMSLTPAEEQRILAAADRINGRVADVPVLNASDGAYMNSARDTQHAAVMNTLSKLLDKADGGYIVGLLNAIPAAVLNQTFALPDGTNTNLAGILTQISTKPAAVTNVTAAPIDVDALVARLKAELPAAVLAQLTTKLSQP